MKKVSKYFHYSHLLYLVSQMQMHKLVKQKSVVVFQTLAHVQSIAAISSYSRGTTAHNYYFVIFRRYFFIFQNKFLNLTLLD